MTSKTTKNLEGKSISLKGPDRPLGHGKAQTLADDKVQMSGKMDQERNLRMDDL